MNISEPSKELPQTQPSDYHQMAAAEQLEYAISLGNHELALNILVDEIVEIWFTLHPERLRSIAAILKNIDADKQHGIANQLYEFISSTGQAFLEEDIDPEKYSSAMVPFVQMAAMFYQRLRGNLTEARQLAEKINEHASQAMFPTYSPAAEHQLVFFVQNGITGMLQGDFRWALQQFTNAQLNFDIPSLNMLKRDAYAKAALLAVLFGKMSSARYCIEQAKRIEMSTSWAEPAISATVSIVDSLLEQHNPIEAVKHLENIELSALNEMWPYYILAYWKLCVISGGNLPVPNRVQALMKSPMIAQGHEGVMGSAIHILETMKWVSESNLEKAQEALLKADQSFIGTQLLNAQLYILQENYQQCDSILDQVEDLADLQQLQMWKLSMQSTSLYRQGNEQAAHQILRDLNDFLSDGYTEEILFLPKDVYTFAKNQVEGWGMYAIPSDAISFGYRQPLAEEITNREKEILKLLAKTELSQREIAEQLFISVNTLKTHIRSLYRKLDVNNRAQAGHEALARGLFR